MTCKSGAAGENEAKSACKPAPQNGLLMAEPSVANMPHSKKSTIAAEHLPLGRSQ
jgi:hypothetical protein